MTTRRGFLMGAAALLASPAVVRAELIMPVRRVIVPPPIPSWCPPGWLPCDGREISATEFPDLVSVLARTVVPDLGARDDAGPLMPGRPRSVALALRHIICTVEDERSPYRMPVGSVVTVIGR